MKATFPDHAERLEVITIEDVVTADVREALKGMDYGNDFAQPF